MGYGLNVCMCLRERAGRGRLLCGVLYSSQVEEDAEEGVARSGTAMRFYVMRRTD
jgi:hypothetical protein